jgi:hypothetical protein
VIEHTGDVEQAIWLVCDNSGCGLLTVPQAQAMAAAFSESIEAAIDAHGWDADFQNGWKAALSVLRGEMVEKPPMPRPMTINLNPSGDGTVTQP